MSGERRARGRGGSFPGREQREGEPGFADGEQRRGRADTVGMGAKSKVSASRSSAASGSLEEYAPAGSEGDTADLFESDTEELATEGDLQIEPDMDLSALFGDMEDQKPEGSVVSYRMLHWNLVNFLSDRLLILGPQAG